MAAGDVSTDGRWCFMIFKVQLSAGVPAHWALLKKRLEAVCPSAAGEHQLWRWSSLPRDFQHPFLLQVASYDRRGFLHGAPPSCAHLPGTRATRNRRGFFFLFLQSRRWRTSAFVCRVLVLMKA